MRHAFVAAIAALVTLLTPAVSAQFSTDVPSTGDYVRLLKATRFVENYKEMAAVSARVFSARAQGSDKHYARVMAVVATADLSDAQSCLIEVYRAQDLTKQDIATVVSILESPLGSKLSKVSQRKFLTDLEHGSVQPFPVDAFTDEEKGQIVALRQNPSFRKHSQTSANTAFAGSMAKCILESSAVKKASIPRDGK